MSVPKKLWMVAEEAVLTKGRSRSVYTEAQNTDDYEFINTALLSDPAYLASVGLMVKPKPKCSVCGDELAGFEMCGLCLSCRSWADNSE